MRFTREKFKEAIFAQADSGDYDCSGYVVCLVGDVYALAKFGHCSCYDTFEDLADTSYSDDNAEYDLSFDWTGTEAELRDMAQRKADPTMPGRSADPKDYDYEHLTDVYATVLEILGK